MFDAFSNWVIAILGSQYQYARGQWVDTQATTGQFICAIRATGGGPITVGVRRKTFQVILLGPVSGRQHAIKIQADADTLAEYTLGTLAPCDAAAVRVIGEASGPFYTTENRAWVSIDFEVLF